MFGFARWALTHLRQFDEAITDLKVKMKVSQMQFDQKALEAALMEYQRKRMAEEFRELIVMGPKWLGDIRQLYEIELHRRQKLRDERIGMVIVACMIGAILSLAVVSIGGLK